MLRMSHTGKKDKKYKSRNKSQKKNTISYLRDLLNNNESEFQELLEQVNLYYDELISSIKIEHETIIHQLNKIFSLRTSRIQDCITSQ